MLENNEKIKYYIIIDKLYNSNNEKSLKII